MSRRSRAGRAGRPVPSEPAVVNGLSAGEIEDRLLAEVGRGNQAAFDQLYDRVSASIYGLVKRVVRDTAQAEEVTQEVMVEVWRTAPRFDAGKGRARTWCLTLAHRRAVDRVRSEESARRREVATAPLEPRISPDVSGEVVDRLDQERVARALDELTALQQQALTLSFYEGRTHTEVSALLDVPLGTVKTRIRDGLIRLRDEMGVTP